MSTMRRLLVPVVATLLLTATFAAPAGAVSVPVIASITTEHATTGAVRTFTASPAAGNEATPQVRVTGMEPGKTVTLINVATGATLGSCIALTSTVTFNGPAETNGCLAPSGTFSFPTANYKYTIRADAEGGTSSAKWDYFYDTIAPHAVPSLTAGLLKNAGISLRWSQVVDNTSSLPTGGSASGVEFYELSRKKDGGAYTVVSALRTRDTSCSSGACGVDDLRDGADSDPSEPTHGATYTYRISPVDLAGNFPSTVATSNSVTADGSAPALPSQPVVTPAGSGNDATPLIATTTTDAGTLQLLVDGAPAGTAIAATATTEYKWNDGVGQTVDLGADGTYEIRLRISDELGNSADTAATSYTLDTAAPGAPTISGVAGFATSPAAARDDTPAVTVSGAATGEDVLLSLDADNDATAETYVKTAASDVAFNPDGGAVDFTLTGGDRAVELTAATRDAAGNVSPASAPFVYELDTTPPAAPAAPTVSQLTTGGVNVAWTAVADAAPFADRAVVYQVRRAATDPNTDGSCPAANLVSPTLLDATGGDTSYVDDSAPNAKCVYYAIVAVDRVGNSATGATSAGIVVDTAAPPAPSTPTVTSGQTTTHDPGHGIDDTPLIATTTGAEGGTLRLLVNDVVVGSPITAEPSTEYTWNDGVGPGVDLDDHGGDRAHAVRVTLTDEWGNTATTPATGYTLDRVAPADASITEVAGAAPPTATNDTTPSVVVAGALTGEYAVLTLDADGSGTDDAPIAKAAASAVTFNGSSTDFTLTGSDRTVGLTARVRDKAGNVSVNAATASFDLDTAAPDAPGAPTTRQLSGEDVEVDWADVADVAPYADRPVTYTLQRATEASTAGSCTELSISAYTDQATGLTTSKYVDTTLSAGTCAYYKVVAVDHVANASPASTASAAHLVEAGATPSAPTINSGSPSEGGTGTPAIVIDATEPGGTVDLFAGSTKVATATVPSTVDPSVTLTAGDYSGEVPHGLSTLTATHTNNGQTSTASAGFEYRRAPAAPAVASVELDSSSPASGTDSTPDVTVSGVVEGHTVKLWAAPTGGTATQVASKTVPSGATSVSLASADYPGSLKPGTYTLTATATDPAFSDATTGTSAHSAGFTYERIAVIGGYHLDGYGGLHAIGATPGAKGAPYFPGLDVARDVELIDPTDPSKGGYVLDAYGGIHAFNGAPAMKGGPYWAGWDIARDLVVTGPGKGYLLDGFAGIHRLGGAPKLSGGPYFSGHDIARSLVVTKAGGAYVLDGYAGIHRVNGAPALGKGPYWAGWDIANDLGLVDPADPSKGAYVLDGYGGVHSVGKAPAVSVSAYLAGDPHRFHSIQVIGAGAGYTSDTRGQVARFGSAPTVLRPARFSFDIGRGLAIALL